MQADRRETTKREDIEALKSRLESDKIWAGNEVEKLRLKKEAALELSGIHIDQAVRYSTLIAHIVIIIIIIIIIYFTEHRQIQL